MQKKAPRRATLRQLPSVSRLLGNRALAPVLRRCSPPLVTDLIRERLEELRRGVQAGRLGAGAVRREASAAAIARWVAGAAADILGPRPRPVINATGVVVHTNLGRAVLSAEAARELAESSRGYLDLEYDVGASRRGERMSHLEPLMARLFPGRAFTVVNNNAAAILIGLRALARGREVLVSRGELVEIGGSFRVPDILAASGARLREVGTTNRTRLRDYEAALSPATGLILKVHTSNFRIVGFAGQTAVGELADLARRTRLPLVVDWGSGDLVDLTPLAITDEIPVRALLEAGADLVTFSGDKLLGGPQSGFVVGRRELVERVRRDPLSRACRLDRLRIGALQRTLAAYVRGRAWEEVPTLRMLAASAEEVGRRAARVRDEVVRRAGAHGRLALVDGVSLTGGGSSPAGERPTRLLAVCGPSDDAAGIERRLRAGEPPVVGRLHEGRLLLDLRTVLPDQEAILVKRLAAALVDAAEAAPAGRVAPAGKSRP
jgi:L-seryl-tRNA(Ser) seleniumtransferase